MIYDVTDPDGKDYIFTPGVPCLDGEPVNLAFYVDTEAGIINTYQMPGFDPTMTYSALAILPERRPPGTLETEPTQAEIDSGIACGVLYRVLTGKVTIEPWI